MARERLTKSTPFTNLFCFINNPKAINDHGEFDKN